MQPAINRIIISASATMGGSDGDGGGGGGVQLSIVKLNLHNCPADKMMPSPRDPVVSISRFHCHCSGLRDVMWCDIM